MTKQEKEIQELKERIAHLEGVIEGMKVRQAYPVLPQIDTNWDKKFVWPNHYTVIC